MQHWTTRQEGGSDARAEDCVSTLPMSQALLRAPNTANVGSINTFGDQQLEADVEADRIVFDALRSCGAVACASSEETTDVQNLGGSNYSVRLVMMATSSGTLPKMHVSSEHTSPLASA